MIPLPLPWLRPWMFYAALCALIGALCLYCSIHWHGEGLRKGRAEVQATWDAEKVQLQAAAIKAQQDNATETARRQTEQQEIVRVTEKHASVRRDDLAAVDAARSVRDQQLAAVAARGRDAAADPAASDSCKAAAETSRVLAELLSRAESRSRAVAEFADEAADAGTACQQSYNALTPDPMATGSPGLLGPLRPLPRPSRTWPSPSELPAPGPAR